MDKSGIWKHWSSKVESSEVSCIYCFKLQAKHASRLKRHTSVCIKAPKSVRDEFQSLLPLSVAGKRQVFMQRPSSQLPLPEGSSLPTPTLQLSELRQEDIARSDMAPPNNMILEPMSQQNLTTESGASAANSAVPAAATSLPFALKQATLDGIVNRLSLGQLKELHTLFVKAMVSGNVPFNWLANPYLAAFFEALGSGFTLPTRKEAAGKILDNLEQQAATTIKTILQEEMHFSLIPDGWTNIRGISVINMMLGNTGVCVYIRSIETGEDRQTGIYVKAKLQEIIEEVSKQYGESKIVAIVSDQGGNYLWAREAIAAENPQIISINCAAHLLNLLAGDFCKFPSVQQNVIQAKNIVKEIKNSKVKLGAYYAEYKRYNAEKEELGEPRVRENALSFPCVTRWFGIRHLIQKLFYAKPILERLAIGDKAALAHSVKTAIKSDSFWNKLGSIYDVIKRITDGILFLESQSACISDVVEEFLKLGEVFTEYGSSHSVLVSALDLVEVHKAKSIFLQRSKDKNVTVHHYIANLLDPRYKGQRFAADPLKFFSTLMGLETYAQKTKVAVTQDQRQVLGTQLTAFRNGDGYFSLNMLHHSLPHVFWKNYLQFPETSMIAQIGCRLLSIPATSAGVERSFSVQGNVHTKSRNRLSEVKIDKMMRIKWSLTHESKQVKMVNELRKKAEKRIEEMECEDCLELGFDIDEIIDLEEKFSEMELYDTAENSPVEAENPVSNQTN